jgi:hypothetical protein
MAVHDIRAQVWFGGARHQWQHPFPDMVAELVQRLVLRSAERCRRSHSIMARTRKPVPSAACGGGSPLKILSMKSPSRRKTSYQKWIGHDEYSIGTFAAQHQECVAN